MKFSRQFIILLFSVSAFAAMNVSAQDAQIAANATPAGVKRDAETTVPSTPNSAATTPSVTGISRVGVQTAQPLPLSLNDAIRKALEGNNDIEISRDDVRFQETQLRSLAGIYDPVLRVQPNFSRSQTTGNAATRDFRVNSDLTGFVRPGGGNYQVFFNNSRSENAFTQAQLSSGNITGSSSTSAIYSSGLGVTYVQPLFRNFRIDTRRQQIKIAQKRLSQTDADFRRQTIEIIANVQKTYWDLVFALRDQQNRVANVNLAQENLRQIEAKIEAGAAAPLEKAEVATELANRQSDLLLATQQVSITENALKQLVIKDPSAAEWTQTYVPTDKPMFSLDAVNLDDAMKDAMDNRFELRRLKLQKEINDIDLKYYKNQMAPQIDLNTTFSLDGLSRAGNFATGTTFIPTFTGNDAILLQNLNTLLPAGSQIANPLIAIPPTPSFFVGGFNRSLANIFRSDAPNFSIGVTFSFPIRNRTAKANYAGARIQEEQIAAQTRSQEQTVIAEVRNAVQAVETARQRVLTARTARENAEIQLEGERKLYDAGRSTTFLLFQRENSLTNARNAEIRAETDYNKAIADLQKVTSTTFRINNIVVDSPTNQQ
ncbi:MAG TPA: TolC family protein [Pyrinomonadaceae bacterium]|nr:TolC family protein [Pyrinomonadaceae bacterium]